MENVALLVTAQCSAQPEKQKFRSYSERKQHKKEMAGLLARSTTASQATSSRTSEPTTGVKFLSAGLAACSADLMTFPLDTAKVRLQVGIQELQSI